MQQLRLTGAQQAACGRFGRNRWGQALVACNVGQEGGEVESRALAHGRQDGWRSVRGQGGGVVGQAYWRAQVALVGGDAGVEGWRDEGGWLVRGDDERLGARSSLKLGFSILVQPRIIFPVLDGRRFEVHFRV